MKTNEAVLKGLKEDTQWSGHLMQACLDDHEAGRMGMPRMLHEVSLEKASECFAA